MSLQVRNVHSTRCSFFLIVQEDGAGVVDMKIPKRARIVQSAYQEECQLCSPLPRLLAYSKLPTYRTYLYKHGAPHPSPSSTCRVPQEKKQSIKRPRAHLSTLETPPR